MATDEIFSGSVRPVDDTPPPRSTLGYLGDQAKAAAGSFLDLPAGAIAVGRDTATEPQTKKALTAWGDLIADTKEAINTSKTPYGRHVDETGGKGRGLVQQTAEGLVNNLGLVAATALMPEVVGAGVAGGALYGTERARQRQVIRNLTRDQLDSLRQGNETDEQIADRLDEAGKTGAAIEGASGALGAGFLQRAARPIRSSLMPKAVDDMVDRVTQQALRPARGAMRGAAVMGAEGAVAGAVQGGGSELGQQRTAIDTGMTGQKDYDWGKVWEEAKGGAGPLALLGGTAGAIAGRRLSTRAPEISTDVVDTAKKQLAETGQPKPPAGAEEPTPPVEQPAPAQAPPPEAPPTPAAPPPEAPVPVAAAPTPPAGPASPIDGMTRAQVLALAQDATKPMAHKDAHEMAMAYAKAHPDEPSIYTELVAAASGSRKQAAAFAKAEKLAAAVAKKATEIGKPEITPEGKVEEGKLEKTVAASKTTEDPAAPEDIEQALKLRAEPPVVEPSVERPTEPPVEKAPAEVTPPSKPVAEEAPARPTLTIKKPVEAVSGEAAQPKLNKGEQIRAERKTEALEIAKRKAVEEIQKKPERKADTTRVQVRREDAYDTREKAAFESREATKPGENYAAELKDRLSQLTAARGEKAEKLVRQTIDEAKQIKDEYATRMDQLLEERGEKEIFGRFNPATRSIAKNAGPFHTYQVAVHNFVRGTSIDLMKKQGAAARLKTIEHLKRELKMLEKGGPVELYKAQRERNARLNVEKKEVSVDQTSRAGEGAGEDTEQSRREQIQAQMAKAREGASLTPEEHAIAAQEEKPFRRLTKAEREARGMLRETHADDFVGGKKEEVDNNRSFELGNIIGGEALGKNRMLHTGEQIAAMEREGEKVERTNLGELMGREGMRPQNEVLASVFDHIRNLVKDTDTRIISSTAMDGIDNYSASNGRPGKSRAFYSPSPGIAVFRRDTTTQRTVFHEALHAATSRALITSPQFERMVRALQSIVSRHYGRDPTTTVEMWYDRGVARKNPHEFLSELFTRPEMYDAVKEIKLNRADLQWLTNQGYDVNKGKGILGTLWHGFLKAIGFEAERPNAMKVAIDLLSDMSNYEQDLRRGDRHIAVPVGSLSAAAVKNLRRNDPIMARAIERAKAGQNEDLVNQLMKQADRIARDLPYPHYEEVTDYLTRLSEESYERPRWEPKVTPAGTTGPEIHEGAYKNIMEHMGEKAKDLAFQVQRAGFSQSIGKLVHGLQFTNDLGMRGEQAFQKVLSPLKETLALRSGFVNKYLEKSGSNELLNHLATTVNVTKDRKMWNDFQRFMIEEGYHGAYADEKLGEGRNKHVDGTQGGALSDEQARQEHERLSAEWERLKARNPDLEGLRKSLHDWGAQAIKDRVNAHVSDAVWRSGLTDQQNAVGRSALTKHVLRDDKNMTAEEKAEYAKIETKDPDGLKDTVKLIRSIPEFKKMAGPYVPFMRHGKHAVYAEYNIKPDEGVDFKSPIDADKLQTTYDFKNRADAEAFIKKQLGGNGITQLGGGERVYDTGTGKRATLYSDAEMKQFAEEDKEKPREERRRNKYLKPKDLEKMKEDGNPTGHLELRHRVTFNPRELQFFDSQRLAQEHSDMLRGKGDLVRSTSPETPESQINRANVSYVSAEMQRWMNRIESSDAYQKMTEGEQAEWKRELKEESARVTMQAGRRSMFLPREYYKGASADLLRNYNEAMPSHARAMADLTYRGAIDKARDDIREYNEKYRYGMGDQLQRANAEYRRAITTELERRITAPAVEHGMWNTFTKRALQVSMVSHLADTGFLILNSTEPWVIHLPIMAGRHGYMRSAAEMARSYGVIDVPKLAQLAAHDIKQGFTGKGAYSDYRQHLLQSVTGQKDAKGLQAMISHLFDTGLISPDAEFETKRINDPTASMLGRGLDHVDNGFRGANMGVETVNRAVIGISAYRLEMARALREKLSPEEAQAKATEYARQAIFKGAGDYAAWNNPRYFNSPWAKLGLQFKKYPLRVATNYVDAVMSAFKGETGEIRSEARKRLAYMVATQSMAAGMLGLPLGPFAGSVNAAYLLGMSDSNWEDYQTGFRRALNDTFQSPELTEVMSHGIFRLAGADLGSRESHSNLFFFGSPSKPDLKAALGSAGVMAFGAPGDAGVKFFTGVHNAVQATQAFAAGATDQGWAKTIEAMPQILQVKMLSDIGQVMLKMEGGAGTKTRAGLPMGNGYDTGQAIWRAIGITPAEEAEKTDKRQAITRQQQLVSSQRQGPIQMWVKAANSTEKSAIWNSIQNNYNARQTDDHMKIRYSDLLAAQRGIERQSRRDTTGVGVPLSRRRESLAQVGDAFNTRGP